jgi:hypothetical protein
MSQGGGWEADDDFIDDGEGYDDDADLEDEVAVQAAPAPTPVAQASKPSPAVSGPRGIRPGRGPTPNGQPKRQLKVKPMPTGMRAKWPDVKSVLLTLDSGSQVIFVRGA